MRNFLLYISLITFTVNAYSQSLEYDWVIGTSSDSIFSSYSHNIHSSQNGDLYLQLSYTSESTLKFGNYVFPADNNFSNWVNESYDDTSYLVGISSAGYIQWDTPIYNNIAYIKNVTSQNCLQVMYGTLDDLTIVYFGGDTIYSFNHNSSIITNAKHLILTNYNGNGTQGWASFISSSSAISGSYELVSDENSNLYISVSFKKDIYYQDSLLFSTPLAQYNSAWIKLAPNGDLLDYKVLNGTGTGNVIFSIQEIDNTGIMYCICSSYNDTTYYDGTQLPSYNQSNPQAWLTKIDTLGVMQMVVSYPMNMGILDKVIDGEYYTHKYFTNPYILVGNDTLLNPSSGIALGIIKLDSNYTPIWMTAFGNVSYISQIAVNDAGYTFIYVNNINPTSPTCGEIIFTPNDTIESLNSPIISVINKNGVLLDTKILAPQSYFDDNYWGLEADNWNQLYIRGSRENYYYAPDTFYFDEDTIVESDNLLSSVYVFKMHLELPEITKQDIDLNQGWNLWSTYIEPDSPAIATVLNPIVNQTQIAKNQYGQVYWPLYGLDMIGDIVIGQAYYTKVDTTLILQVAGVPVEPELTPIPLTQTWSYLGYLRQDTANVVSMLTSIGPNVIITKDDLGQVYWPLFGLNSIGVMEPGEGYQIKVAQPDTLVYPPN